MFIMTFRVTKVDRFCWPDQLAVDRGLEPLGLNSSSVCAALQSFTDDTDPSAKRYTETLAHNMARHLAQQLRRPGTRSETRQVHTRYSPQLDHNADVAVAPGEPGRSAFIEIEFRPNFEKDLVKFQVGHHSGRLAVGIIVVAVDRDAIRDTYTSMPEFASVTAVLASFRPLHPVLVLGMHADRGGGSGTA